MTKDKFEDLQWLAGKTVSNIESLVPKIEHTFNNNNIAECKQALHSLKGGTAVLGAKKLSALVKKTRRQY